MSAPTPDLSFLPAKVRTVVYSVAIALGVVSGAATKGFTAIGHAQPVWLAFVNGALPDVLTAAGAVALSHVATSRVADTLVAVTAAPTVAPVEDDEDGENVVDPSQPDGDPGLPDEQPTDDDPEVTASTPAPELGSSVISDNTSAFTRA